MAYRDGYLQVERGLRLRYRIAGHGHPTVVMPNAAAVAEDLAPFAEGRAMLFCDRRGRGASAPVTDPAHLGIEHDVRDLEAVRCYFALDRMALLGWSYTGGMVARYAQAHPARVSRLLLSGAIPPHRPDSQAPGALAARTRAEARVDPNALGRLDELRRSGLPERDPVAYRREFLRVDTARQMGNPAALDRMRSDPCQYPNEWPDNLAAHLEYVMGSLGDWDWRPQLRSLDVPTLVVRGSEDGPVARAREWAITLPNARLLLIPGAGHFPWLDAPKPSSRRQTTSCAAAGQRVRSASVTRAAARTASRAHHRVARHALSDSGSGERSATGFVRLCSICKSESRSRRFPQTTGRPSARPSPQTPQSSRACAY